MTLSATATPTADARLTEWLGGCAAGDVAAFEALFDHCAPWLWRVLRQHGVGADEAEQLLEAVCWRAWREAGRFDATDAGSARRWLLGLVTAELTQRAGAEAAPRAQAAGG